MFEDYRDWDETDWRDGQPVREPMGNRSAPGPRRRLTADDKRIRRRMRRSGAVAQEESMVSTPERAQLLAKIASASSLAEQAQLISQLDEMDQTARRTAARERELQLADTSIGEAMTPLVSRTARATAASDWLVDVDEPEAADHTQIVAQAALWFGQTSDVVRADAGEFAEQARGQARRVTAGLDPAGERVFTEYVTFLRTQAGSGIDQIQQTTAPDGVTERPTPLPPDTFDNFAPPVNDLNAGVVGTETSERAPAIQQAMTNGGGSGAPEVPGGHNETGVLTGPAPEPSLQGGGGSVNPEQTGGHNETSAVPTTGGPGAMPQQAAPTAPPSAAQGAPQQAAPAGGQQAAPAASGGPCGCSDCAPGQPCSCSCSSGGGNCSCGCASGGGQPPRTAASGLQQIQQTVDVKNEPHTTPLPTQVAFPWELDEPQQGGGLAGQAEYEQGGPVPATHNSTPAFPPRSAMRRQADTWTQPHQLVQPNIANTPATTPPRNVGQAGDGRADARAVNTAPSFGDAHAAPDYTEAYTSVDQAASRPQDVPVSMGGDNGQSLKHPAYASRKVASRQEMRDPDFQRGYKYAMRWQPGTPLVRPGSAALEAGIYAGLTDHPAQRGAWLAAHAKLAKAEPGLGRRIAKHREFTHKVAFDQALATDGTYLQTQAATGIDLDTTNPSTSVDPNGGTPLMGTGRPGPLAGQEGAAAPGGPAPYNGAEPFGSPVVPPTPSIPQGTPVTIPDTGMAAPLRSGEGLSPSMLAFRRTVQANKLAANQRKEN